MAPSKLKIPPHRVRAALTLAKTSVPTIALANGCSKKTLYAVLKGDRPGNNPKVRKAIRQMEQIVAEVLGA